MISFFRISPTETCRIRQETDALPIQSSVNLLVLVLIIHDQRTIWALWASYQQKVCWSKNERQRGYPTSITTHVQAYFYCTGWFVLNVFFTAVLSVKVLTNKISMKCPCSPDRCNQQQTTNCPLTKRSSRDIWHHLSQWLDIVLIKELTRREMCNTKNKWLFRERTWHWRL